MRGFLSPPSFAKLQETRCAVTEVFAHKTKLVTPGAMWRGRHATRRVPGGTLRAYLRAKRLPHSVIAAVAAKAKNPEERPGLAETFARKLGAEDDEITDPSQPGGERVSRTISIDQRRSKQDETNRGIR